MNSPLGNWFPFVAGVTSGALAISAYNHLQDDYPNSSTTEQNVEQVLNLESLAELTKSENVALRNSAIRIIQDRAMTDVHLKDFLFYCADNSDPQSRLKAVTVIQMLSRLDDFIPRLVDAGALKVLGSCLTEDNNDLLKKNALSAIYDLIHGNDERRATVVELNLLKPLTEFISDNNTTNGIRYWSLMIVFQCSINVSLHPALIQNNFPILLTRTARKTFGALNVPKLCLQTLVRIIMHSGSQDSVELLKPLLNENVVSLVSSCLREYQDDLELTYWAIGLAHEFVVKMETSRPLFCNIKGVIGILNELIKSDEAYISRVVLRTLKFMAVKNEPFQLKIISSGVLPKIIKCLSSTDDDTQYWAIVLIDDLAVHSSSHKEILDSLGINSLINLSKSSKPLVPLYVADILNYLCVNTEAHDALLSSNILDAVQKFMVSGDYDLVYSGTSIIYHLSSVSESLLYKLDMTACSKMLITVIGGYEEVKLQILVAKALVNLSNKSGHLAASLAKSYIPQQMSKIVAQIRQIQRFHEAEKYGPELHDHTPDFTALDTPSPVSVHSSDRSHLDSDSPSSTSHFPLASSPGAHSDHISTSPQLPLESPMQERSPDSSNLDRTPIFDDETILDSTSPLNSPPGTPSSFFTERLSGMYDTLYILLRQPILLESIVDFFIYQHKSLGEMLWILLLPIHSFMLKEQHRGPVPSSNPQETPKSGLKDGYHLSLDSLEKFMSSTTPFQMEHFSKMHMVHMLKLSATVAKVLAQLHRHDKMKKMLTREGFPKQLVLLYSFNDPTLCEEIIVRLAAMCSFGSKEVLISARPILFLVWSRLMQETRMRFHTELLLHTLFNYSAFHRTPLAVTSPPYVEMCTFDKTSHLLLSADRLRIYNNDTWGFESGRATRGVIGKGKYAYEVLIHTNEVIQIGWATRDSAFEPELGSGIGDDDMSYAVDGNRCKKWHGFQPENNDYGEPWEMGDVITCLLDLDNAEISYMRNGKHLGVAFSNIIKDQTLYPACSLSNGQDCRFRFGDTFGELDYLPDGYQPMSTLAENDRLQEALFRDYEGFSPEEKKISYAEVVKSSDMNVLREVTEEVVIEGQDDIGIRNSEQVPSSDRIPSPEELQPVKDINESPQQLEGDFSPSENKRVLGMPLDSKRNTELPFLPDWYFEVKVGLKNQLPRRHPQIGVLDPLTGFTLTVVLIGELVHVISCHHDPQDSVYFARELDLQLHELLDDSIAGPTSLRPSPTTEVHVLHSFQNEVIHEGMRIGCGYAEQGAKVFFTLDRRIYGPFTFDKCKKAKVVPYTRSIPKMAINFGQNVFHCLECNSAEVLLSIMKCLSK